MHYPVKSMLMGGDNGEDEEKFNKMMNIEMEEQRKNIKSKVIHLIIMPFHREKTLPGRSSLKRRRDLRRRTLDTIFLNID